MLGVAVDQDLLEGLAPAHQTGLDRTLGDLQNASRLLDLEALDVDQEEGLAIAVVEVVEGGAQYGGALRSTMWLAARRYSHVENE
jgi:hypothetical protein